MLISQAKLIHHGEIVGYVVIGVSPKHHELALDYLRLVLLILFPVSVLVILISARWIAAKAIRPVFDIIDTAQSISESTLSQRVPLPTRKDELYQLAKTINSLLDRLEYQIIKAKQFSADASHELRTPLTIIKGTLGILIRRKRTQEEYQDKINYTLKQIDRLDALVEQFLLLSRVENNSLQLKKTNFDLKVEVLHTLERFDLLLHEKQITTKINQLHSFTTENYREFIEIILDNILSNAIKYTSPKGQITLSSKQEENTYILSIKDNGIGMKSEDVLRIENRHFRSDDVETKLFLELVWV
ncbi:histidine kinase dimerization/phospho-acceptor domain-containing protein [Weeksella virosa]|uniref:histidine kinase dimerization/phospho-acceptor domain-containing protein n=1 Tax=Weeksella virosa TaxID=1014 RepID=UPI000312BB64|nr:histidine kinase dimerization/phospho-acceptor domain-containing protein [Weeksella virosa]VEH64051.1 Signal transduction histidine-protein kinase ArlS [Weeksella virosa]